MANSKLSQQKYEFSQSESNKLSNLGLPMEIQQKYECRGITRLFPWQVECLACDGVLDDRFRNLVYSAPTSAGKTLIAEIIAIKTVLERGRKVVFILPFISVVREKMLFFQDIFGSSGIRVDGFMGSYNPAGGFKAVQVAICTIERANSLINRLLEAERLSEIGAVIVDELHMIGDPGRGYLLELLLTKLRYISLKDAQLQIQIVGMSATLPNLDMLSKWLDAALYATTFRPIPLYEQFIHNGELFNRSLETLRRLESLPELGKDTDHILQLCLEPILEGCSVLVFCPAKNWCEKLAEQVSAAFYKLGVSGSALGMALRAQLDAQTILECLEQLKRSPSGLDEVLRKTISFGVSFHHAGLTMDERDIIEAAFRAGILRVLIATSTLSSGVNLPARRVIIRTPMFFGKPIDILSYKQMVGRAGRMGKDTSGESILICKANEVNIAKQLISGELDAIESCLQNSGRINRALLEVIASGVAATPSEVEIYAACTLLHQQSTDEENSLDSAIEYLSQNEFVRLQITDEGESRYIATPLAKACLNSSMPPEEAKDLLAELEKARQCLVLDTDLHLIYLVTPMTISLPNIDWMHYLELWEALSGSMRRVGELVGVKLSFIVNCTRGKTSNSMGKLAIHARFYTALALQDLINEVPLSKVAVKFNCNRGALQGLQQSAATYAGRVTAFTKQLQWGSIELLLAQFQDRFQFGVSRDLLDLMRLPIINAQRARLFYDQGVQSVVELAACDPFEVENILHRAMPFESKERKEGESEGDAQRRQQMRIVFITGMQGLTELEAARLMVQDARKYLQFEIGLSDANWKGAEKGNEQEERLNDEITQTEAKNAVEEEEIGEKTDLWDSLSFGDCNPDIKVSNKRVADVDSLRLNDLSVQEVRKSCESLFNDSLEDQFKNLPSFEHKDFENDSHLAKAFAETFNASLGDKTVQNEVESTFIDFSLAKAFSESFDLPTESKECNAIEEKSSFFMNFLNDSKIIDLQTSVNIEESQSTSHCFEIIRVTDHPELYRAFVEQLAAQQIISIALACEKHEEQKQLIGLRRSTIPVDKFVWHNCKLMGIAIYWPSSERKDSNKFTSFYFDVQSEIVHYSDLCRVLFAANSKKTLRLFNAKEQMKLIVRILQSSLENVCIEDPMLAEWSLNPDVNERDIFRMIHGHAPHLDPFLGFIDRGNKSSSLRLGSRIESTTSAKLRACLEAFLTWNLMESLIIQINHQDCNLIKCFETEMKIVDIICQMELTGVPIDVQVLQKCADELKTCTQSIESEAFTIAGRRFSFISPSAVAQVLQMRSKSKKSTTNKAALIQYGSPLAQLIIQWRKINCALTKMIYPLLRCVQNGRVHGTCILHNSTGRITMHEPNLQNVPRDFDFVEPITGKTRCISLRSAFALPAESTHIFVSADYCQLELRILAHLSQEETLCAAMRCDGDIFAVIAAEWRGVDEQQVDVTLRQQTKQICYGIIYGIGAKSLSEQMSVTEEEAGAFIESFHAQFPGIREFVTRTVQDCRRNEFVETLLGRRRYLPHVNSLETAERSRAERQAINTRIQGSAADIVKRAMVMLHETVRKKFRNSRNMPALILQIHDELLFELPDKYEVVFVKLLRKCMQKSVALSVPLPVKVQKGKSWGKMSLVDTT